MSKKRVIYKGPEGTITSHGYFRSMATGQVAPVQKFDLNPGYYAYPLGNGEVQLVKSDSHKPGMLITGMYYAMWGRGAPKRLGFTPSDLAQARRRELDRLHAQGQLYRDLYPTVSHYHRLSLRRA